ncbi:MAG TPA: FAD-dependent oxidoreductase [Stellaceae bacterium]|nr:FAD-dependent oxidoreductase [Stellaceae bacterium]
MPLSVAIVGAGPAGCAVAERLSRKSSAAIVDVIEKLPTPGGLIRSGVAPDRPKAKALAAACERALGQRNVALWGNVELGRDVTLNDLRRLYDVVVLATGLPDPRKLGVPGEDLPGVWPAGEFAGWLNGHPVSRPAPDLAKLRSVIIVGQGSVGLEIARLLAKSGAELARSELDPEIAAALATITLAQIHWVGTRGPEHVKFPLAELAALKKLDAAQLHLDADGLTEPATGSAEAKQHKKLFALLRGIAASSRDGAKRGLRLHFNLRPLRFDGGSRGVERAIFTRPDRLGQNLALRAELIITAIGFHGGVANQDGLAAPGLYAAGWAASGAQGDIAAVAAASRRIADRILAEANLSAKPGRAGLTRHLAEAGVTVVDLAGWQRIDRAERARAVKPRPRRKLRGLNELLTAAKSPQGNLL